MPRAEVTSEAIEYPLETCPPDGFVKIKQLPYHEMLVRRDRAGQLFFNPSDEDGKVEVSTLQAWARAYEFKHCIVDHNLERKDGTPFDFSREGELSFLDPRVGQEIEELIDKLHNVEANVKDFPQPASSSLEEMPVVPDESTVMS
jgi:hypothetical protein